MEFNTSISVPVEIVLITLYTAIKIINIGNCVRQPDVGFKPCSLKSSICASACFFLSFLDHKEYSGPTKFGIVVPVKTHKSAVVRNKLKRITRELVRNNLDTMKEGYWVVIYPKVEILEKSNEEISAAFTKALQRIIIPR